jgi:hypothetical protein
MRDLVYKPLQGAWMFDRYWCPHQLAKEPFSRFSRCNSVCGRKQCRERKKRIEAAKEGKQKMFMGMRQWKKSYWAEVLGLVADFRMVDLEFLPEDLKLLRTQLPDPVPQTRAWQRIAEQLNKEI